MSKQSKLTDKNFLLYMLKDENIFLSKKLGQNFLISNNTVQQITTALNLSENDTVIEIGPGVGAISEQIVQIANKLICIEFDKKLAALLPKNMPSTDNLEVIHQDALKTDFKALASEEEKSLKKGGDLKIFSNLPYNIATSLIITILKETNLKAPMIFMVQQELAERFSAKPNEKNYSATSVIVQCLSDVKITHCISRNNFFPVPNVESVLISVSPTTFLKDNNINDIDAFCKFVKNCFAHRRKTLYNSLSTSGKYNNETLTKSIVTNTSDFKIRAQSLNMQNFANLYKDLTNEN